MVVNTTILYHRNSTLLLAVIMKFGQYIECKTPGNGKVILCMYFYYYRYRSSRKCWLLTSALTVECMVGFFSFVLSRKKTQFEHPNERYLFHAADTVDIIKGICHQGFDMRLAGKHGTSYGKGLNFARNAQYSNSYSSPHGTEQFMFLAQVLTGKSCKGQGGITRPPPIDPQVPFGKLYDSCVNDNSSIYVIFENDQCYPTYLIHYWHEQDPVVNEEWLQSLAPPPPLSVPNRRPHPAPPTGPRPASPTPSSGRASPPTVNDNATPSSSWRCVVM